MNEKAKAARREYFRQYRAAHPEKVREQNRKYWERRAARLEAEQAASKEAEAKEGSA